MINNFLRAFAIMVLIVGASACSSPDSPPKQDVQPSSSSAQPTGTTTLAVAPTAIPSQWRTVNGEDFTIGVPASYTEEQFTASNGTKGYAFDAPRAGNDDAGLVRVAIIRDEEPATDVIEQSVVLEEMQSIENDGRVIRKQLKWPGSEQAVLVQWTNPLDGAEGDRRETWQLMVQINPDLIINVVAIAPAATFADSDVSQVLATFKGA